MVFQLIHSPHCALDVLHPHEALVQAQVVPDRVLPGCCVAPEEGEGVLEPGVDLVQGQLAVRRLDYGLLKEKMRGRGQSQCNLESKR